MAQSIQFAVRAPLDLQDESIINVTGIDFDTATITGAVDFSGATVSGLNVTGNAAIIDDGDGTVSIASSITDVSVIRTAIGLGSIDNTSDANKPVSTATQTALDLKVNLPTAGHPPADQSVIQIVANTGADAATNPYLATYTTISDLTSGVSLTTFLNDSITEYSRSRAYNTNDVVMPNGVTASTFRIYIATGEIPVATDNTSDPGVNTNWSLVSLTDGFSAADARDALAISNTDDAITYTDADDAVQTFTPQLGAFDNRQVTAGMELVARTTPFFNRFVSGTTVGIQIFGGGFDSSALTDGERYLFRIEETLDPSLPQLAELTAGDYTAVIDTTSNFISSVRRITAGTEGDDIVFTDVPVTQDKQFPVTVFEESFTLTRSNRIIAGEGIALNVAANGSIEVENTARAAAGTLDAGTASELFFRRDQLLAEAEDTQLATLRTNIDAQQALSSLTVQTEVDSDDIFLFRDLDQNPANVTDASITFADLATEISTELGLTNGATSIRITTAQIDGDLASIPDDVLLTGEWAKDADADFAGTVANATDAVNSEHALITPSAGQAALELPFLDANLGGGAANRGLLADAAFTYNPSSHTLNIGAAGNAGILTISGGAGSPSSTTINAGDFLQRLTTDEINNLITTQTHHLVDFTTISIQSGLVILGTGIDGAPAAAGFQEGSTYFFTLDTATNGFAAGDYIGTVNGGGVGNRSIAFNAIRSVTNKFASPDAIPVTTTVNNLGRTGQIFEVEFTLENALVSNDALEHRVAQNELELSNAVQPNPITTTTTTVTTVRNEVNTFGSTFTGYSGTFGGGTLNIQRSSAFPAAVNALVRGNILANNDDLTVAAELSFVGRTERVGTHHVSFTPHSDAATTLINNNLSRGFINTLTNAQVMNVLQGMQLLVEMDNTTTTVMPGPETGVVSSPDGLLQRRTLALSGETTGNATDIATRGFVDGMVDLVGDSRYELGPGDIVSFEEFVVRDSTNVELELQGTVNRNITRAAPTATPGYSFLNGTGGAGHRPRLTVNSLEQAEYNDFISDVVNNRIMVVTPTRRYVGVVNATESSDATNTLVVDFFFYADDANNEALTIGSNNFSVVNLPTATINADFTGNIRVADLINVVTNTTIYTAFDNSVVVDADNLTLRAQLATRGGLEIEDAALPGESVGVGIKLDETIGTGGSGLELSTAGLKIDVAAGGGLAIIGSELQIEDPDTATGINGDYVIYGTDSSIGEVDASPLGNLGLFRSDIDPDDSSTIYIGQAFNVHYLLNSPSINGTPIEDVQVVLGGVEWGTFDGDFVAQSDTPKTVRVVLSSTSTRFDDIIVAQGAGLDAFLMTARPTLVFRDAGENILTTFDIGQSDRPGSEITIDGGHGINTENSTFSLAQTANHTVIVDVVESELELNSNPTIISLENRVEAIQSQTGNTFHSHTAPYWGYPPYPGTIFNGAGYLDVDQFSLSNPAWNNITTTVTGDFNINSLASGNAIAVTNYWNQSAFLYEVTPSVGRHSQGGFTFRRGDRRIDNFGPARGLVSKLETLYTWDVSVDSLYEGSTAGNRLNSNYQFRNDNYAGYQIGLTGANRRAVYTLGEPDSAGPGRTRHEAYCIVTIGNSLGGRTGTETFDQNHPFFFRRVWDTANGSSANDAAIGQMDYYECLNGAFPQDISFPAGTTIQVFWIRRTAGGGGQFPRRLETAGGQTHRVGIPLRPQNINGVNYVGADNIAHRANDFRPDKTLEQGLAVYLSDRQLREIKGHTGASVTEPATGGFQLGDGFDFTPEETATAVSQDIELANIVDPSVLVVVRDQNGIDLSTLPELDRNDRTTYENTSLPAGVEFLGVRFSSIDPHVITIAWSYTQVDIPGAGGTPLTNPQFGAERFTVEYMTSAEGWDSILLEQTQINEDDVMRFPAITEIPTTNTTSLLQVSYEEAVDEGNNTQLVPKIPLTLLPADPYADPANPTAQELQDREDGISAEFNQANARVVIVRENIANRHQIEYLRITDEAFQGDSQPTVGSNIVLQELWEVHEFRSSVDLQTLLLNRNNAIYENPIDDSWIPDTVTRDTELANFITADSTNTLTNKMISGDQITSAVQNANVAGSAAQIGAGLADTADDRGHAIIMIDHTDPDDNSSPFPAEFDPRITYNPSTDTLSIGVTNGTVAPIVELTETGITISNNDINDPSTLVITSSDVTVNGDSIVQTPLGAGDVLSLLNMNDADTDLIDDDLISTGIARTTAIPEIEIAADTAVDLANISFSSTGDTLIFRDTANTEFSFTGGSTGPLDGFTISNSPTSGNDVLKFQSGTTLAWDEDLQAQSPEIYNSVVSAATQTGGLTNGTIALNQLGTNDTTLTIDNGLAWTPGQPIGFTATNSEGTWGWFSSVISYTEGATDATLVVQGRGTFIASFGLNRPAVVTNTQGAADFTIDRVYGVSLQGPEGDQGIQGFQGIRVENMSSDGAMVLEGEDTTVTVEYSNPDINGVTPENDTFVIAPGRQGDDGLPGAGGPFLLQLYVDTDGITFPTVAPTGILFDNTGIRDDDSYTNLIQGGFTWTSIPPDPIDETVFTTFSLYDPAAPNAILNWATPYSVTNEGVPGPGGPAGRNPILLQRFWTFDNDGTTANQFGDSTSSLPVFGAGGQLQQLNFRYGTASAVSGNPFVNLTVDQNVSDSDITVGTIVLVQGRASGGLLQHEFTAKVNVIADTSTRTDQQTGVMTLGVEDVIVESTGQTGDPLQWTVAVVGNRGPRGFMGTGDTVTVNDNGDGTVTVSSSGGTSATVRDGVDQAQLAIETGIDGDQVVIAPRVPQNSIRIIPVRPTGGELGTTEIEELDRWTGRVPTETRNQILLTGGFVILTQTIPSTTTRDEYVGSIAGINGPYYYDNTEAAWYDADAPDGNRLIGF